MHDMHADMLLFRLNSHCLCIAPLYVPCFATDNSTYHRRASLVVAQLSSVCTAWTSTKASTDQTLHSNRWYTNHTIGSSLIPPPARRLHIRSDPDSSPKRRENSYRSRPFSLVFGSSPLLAFDTLSPLPQHPNVICKLSIGSDENSHQQQLCLNAELIQSYRQAQCRLATVTAIRPSPRPLHHPQPLLPTRCSVRAALALITPTTTSPLPTTTLPASSSVQLRAAHKPHDLLRETR